jgi:tetratricopeptide (TPR) repeat protein
MALMANDKLKKSCRGKAFRLFLIALAIWPVSIRSEHAFGQSPDNKDAAPADDINVVAKEIQQTYKSLGYADDADVDLVQIVSGWKYLQWRQKLVNAKHDYQPKKLLPKLVAKAEEEVINELVKAIQKNFTSAPADSEYFYLSKVIKDKTAQSLGYCQLIYVLGGPLGLTIRIADVLEPAVGYLPETEEYAACFVTLTDGKTLVVDLTQSAISKPFVFTDQYAAAGNYWDLKSKDNPLKIPRRIQILDRNATLAQIYNNLAYAYAKSGKDDQAISFFSKSAELAPKLAKAFNSRGALYFKKGQFQKAVADLNKAIQLDPKSPEAYFNLGTVYMQSGHIDKALSAFSKSIELKPTFASAYKSRGIIFLNKGKTEAATSDFDKAVELDPKLAAAYVLQGIIYGNAGKNAEAVSKFTKAVELDPNNAEAYNYRGVAYTRLEKYTDAISDFIKAAELNPKQADIYFNRAVVYEALGQNENAISYFTKAMELDPKNVQAYNGRGGVYLNTGQYPQAVSDFTKAIQRNPRNANAFFNRGLANMALKKNELAKSDLLKAMELNPEFKPQVHKALDELR